jgi:hypothetical protein
MEEIPKQRRTELIEAKKEFSRSMLANDTFFNLIKTRLENGRLKNVDLDNFACEPTYDQQEDGSVKVGVRIECSQESRDIRLPEVGISFAVYDYLKIAIIKHNEGVADPVEGLVDEVGAFQDESLPEDERKKLASEATASLFNAWQYNWNVLIRNFKGDTTADPMTGTVAFKSDIENRFYPGE